MKPSGPCLGERLAANLDRRMCRRYKRLEFLIGLPLKQILHCSERTISRLIQRFVVSRSNQRMRRRGENVEFEIEFEFEMLSG
jgi:GGDEF domain-containing protein